MTTEIAVHSSALLGSRTVHFGLPYTKASPKHSFGSRFHNAIVFLQFQVPKKERGYKFQKAQS
jgi:hypothetical protein